ncbi:MAG TPA: DUF1579 family protein [Terriglobales bacterium]|jgi:hypothetical protein|nr:DUF1579 family protein [Terriglobales bacterium]
MVRQSKPQLLILALVVLGCASPCSAQAPLPTPTPTPEHQKMGYFAGDWKMQGTTNISPNAPGAPFTSTEHGEWVSGGFFLETHSSMHSVMGDVRGVRVLEYNPADKVYTYNAYNSLGEHQMATGHLLDNIWMWTSEAQMNGVMAKGRYTITVVSPTSYTFKYETLTSTGTWSAVMEGKATRAQSDHNAASQP